MAAYRHLMLAEKALREVRGRVAAALEADDPTLFEQALEDDRRAGAEHDAACAAMDTSNAAA
jgi:hypothetical protein